MTPYVPPLSTFRDALPRVRSWPQSGSRGAVVRSLVRLTGVGFLCAVMASAQAHPSYPITAEERATAKQVAEAGVPLSELAADAPDSYTVKRGDTLWAISGMFLKHPWLWPQLWGMNMAQIHNPHLIYPGQVVYLDKSNGRARLRLGQSVVGSDGTLKLSPRIRDASLDDAITSVPLSLIEPFMNEAVVIDNAQELEAAPRVMAGPQGRVMVGRGDEAYVRGDVSAAREWRLFREPRALKDPTTHEILGYEAAYVGTADLVQAGGESVDVNGKPTPVPSIIQVTSIRQEGNMGDRLSPVPQREFNNYAPHRPDHDIQGQIVSIYGDGLTAGQSQIVALNKGSQDGMERGLVLGLVHSGDEVRDEQDGGKVVKLPDEAQGLVFVFRVFDRVSYGLILRVERPVAVGDRFGAP